MSLISDVAFELKKLKQDKKSLRNFGITIASAMTVLGLLIFIFGSQSSRAYWLWSIAALFLILGWIAPGILKLFHKFWMGLALVLGWFVSRLILVIIFYVVMMPIAIIMKIMGKDLLNLKIEKNTSTYWIKREPVEKRLASYEKLF